MTSMQKPLAEPPRSWGHMQDIPAGQAESEAPGMVSSRLTGVKESVKRKSRTMTKWVPFEFEDNVVGVPVEEPAEGRPGDNSGKFFYSRSSNARRSLAMNLGIECTAAVVAPTGETASDSDAESSPAMDYVDVYWKATTLSAVRYSIAVSIGRSILDLPCAMSLCGFLPGMFILIVLGMQNLFFMHRVIEAPQLIRKHLAFFEDIARELFGKCGFRIMAFCNILGLFGFMLKVFQYEIISNGKHLQYITKLVHSQYKNDFSEEKVGYFEIFVLVPMLTLLLMPFAFRTSAKALAFNSNVAFWTIRCIVVMVCGISIWRIHQEWGNHSYVAINFNMADQMHGLSLFVYGTFIGPMLLPAVLADMLNPGDAKLVCNRVIKESMVMFTLIGILGYFACSVESGVLRRKDFIKVLSPDGNWSTRIVRFLVTLKNFSGFPLLFCPWRRLVESFFGLDRAPAVALALPWALRQLRWKKQLLRMLLLSSFSVPFIMLRLLDDSAKGFEIFYSFALVVPFVTAIYLFPAIFCVKMWLTDRYMDDFDADASFVSSIGSRPLATITPSGRSWKSSRSSSIVEPNHRGSSIVELCSAASSQDAASMYFSQDNLPRQSQLTGSPGNGGPERPSHLTLPSAPSSFQKFVFPKEHGQRRTMQNDHSHIEIALPPAMAAREAKVKKEEAREASRKGVFKIHRSAACCPTLWQYMADLDEEVSLMTPARTGRGYFLVGISACSAVVIWICVFVDMVAGDHKPLK